MRYHASSFAFVGTLQRARAHLESHLSGSCQLVASRWPPLSSTSQGRVERSLPRRNRIKSGMAMHPCPRESEREREREARDSILLLDGRNEVPDRRSIVRGSFPHRLYYSGIYSRVSSLHLHSNVFLADISTKYPSFHCFNNRKLSY